MNIIYRLKKHCPLNIIKIIAKVYPKIMNDELILDRSLKCYAKYLMNNFDNEIKIIEKNKKLMIIERGEYSYKYFNVSFANNMISLILYAMMKGCIPVIEINKQNNNYNNWDWYFIQPMNLYWHDVKREKCCIKKCNILGVPFRPQFVDAFNLNSEYTKIWQFLYKKFFVLNDETSSYCLKEQSVIDFDNTIGVVMRGTDYLKLKPKFHPIQPNVEEVLEKVEQYKKIYNKEFIYIATEDESYKHLVVNRFGKEHVLENKRKYYDKIYDSNQYDLIGSVNFNRDNDNYLKGLEYLSSLEILSKCKIFVGGNCGATQLAIYINQCAQYIDIINHGLY